MTEDTNNNSNDLPDVVDAAGGVDGNDGTFSSDDLVALIRAVKFAHPEMSMRAVHNEISGTMANSDASYAFLKDLKLNDVKKVWKKALKGTPESKPEDNATKNKATVQGGPTAKPMDATPIPSDGVLKFYTIGDGSVKTLVENYANHYAGAAVAATQQQNADAQKELKKYTHFFADVPADRSGTRPHQALVNFNDNQKNFKRNGKKGVKSGPSKQSNDGDGREIFKIQLAALPPGMEDMLTPMLLYNSDRTTKTFIHPPSLSDEGEDDGGYVKIKTMITESGTSGALGATGGQKAYFWGFVTENKNGPNVISVDIDTGLAPAQYW